MKKIDQSKYLAMGISVLAIVIMLIGFQLIASVIAVIMSIAIGLSKHKSGWLFTFTALFNSLAVGITVDYPFHVFPNSLIFLLMIVVSLNLRNWFFTQLYLYKLPKLELILINLFIICFTVSAILTGYPAQQWIIGGISIYVYIFFSLVIYKDRNEARLKVLEVNVNAGKKAKDFTLPDQNGNPVSLKDLLAKQHILLIFVRGDWCPTCHMMLRGYFKNKEKFAEKNIRIVGIGPDPQGVNKEIMSRIDENSLMLSDDQQETAAGYSTALQENNPITKSLYKNGIPLPASFLIHQNGTIIYTSRSDKAAEILQPDKIFEVLSTI